IGEASWLTRLRYFFGRHRTLTAITGAGLLILSAALGLFISTWWKHQREVALIAFDEGQKHLREGRITEGLIQMRGAIDLLPFGETVLHGYFSRNVISLEASLSRVVDRQSFPSEIQAAVVSADSEGRYVLAGDATGRTTLWDRAGNMTTVLPTRA